MSEHPPVAACRTAAQVLVYPNTDQTADPAGHGSRPVTGDTAVATQSGTSAVDG